MVRNDPVVELDKEKDRIVLNQREIDCSICTSKIMQDDVVSVLACHQNHMMHEFCYV